MAFFLDKGSRRSNRIFWTAWSYSEFEGWDEFILDADQHTKATLTMFLCVLFAGGNGEIWRDRT